MREVLAEQAKRRKKKREAEEDGRAAKRAGAAKTDDAAAAPALGDLAASLKAKLKKKNWNPDQLEGAALAKARFTHATAEFTMD